MLQSIHSTPYFQIVIHASIIQLLTPVYIYTVECSVLFFSSLSYTLPSV